MVLFVFGSSLVAICPLHGEDLPLCYDFIPWISLTLFFPVLPSPQSIEWLLQKGFLRPDAAQPSGFLLLPRGKACAAFADGHPVVVGTVIADGYLEGLTFGEVCAWISLFLRETKVKDASKQGLFLPKQSEKLQVGSLV